MNRNVTIVNNKQMKMSDLIDTDYRLLLLLTRLKFSLGFGDKNVEAVCEKNNFDSDCFLFLVNVQSNNCIPNVEDIFNKLPLEPFLLYLKNSHEYFLEKRLPNIRLKLISIFEEDDNLQGVVLNFFDVYMEEVREHMKYEDDTVFPYVESLLKKEKGEEHYSIDIFEERHNDIENKMTDLKRILIKYISNMKNQDLVISALLDLYMAEEELSVHTLIEDSLVIPRVKNIERY